MIRSIPVLKRFETYVYKDKAPPTDQAQVPAASTVDFYRQGATVSIAVVVPDSSSDPDPQPTNVFVYNTGALAPGDIVQINTASSPVLAVGTVDVVGGIVGIVNGSGNAITLNLGQRLLPTNLRPSIYSDPVGTAAVGTSISTSSTDGRASGYLREFRFDYIVRITGLAARLFVDAEGSFAMRT